MLYSIKYFTALATLDSITIRLSDLLIFIVCVAAAVALVFFIMTLANSNKLIKNINSLVVRNTDNITKAIKDLPDVTGNVSSVTKSVKGMVESAEEITGQAGSVVSALVEAVKKGSGILGIINIITGVVHSFSGLFGKKGKKR